MQDSFSDVKALQTTLFSKDSGGSRQSASDAAENGKYRAAAAKCKVESDSILAQNRKTFHYISSCQRQSARSDPCTDTIICIESMI